MNLMQTFLQVGLFSCCHEKNMYNFNCLKASQSNIPALTATFNECFVPA